MTDPHEGHEPLSKAVPDLDYRLQGTARSMFETKHRQLDLSRWRLTDEQLRDASIGKAPTEAYRAVADAQLTNVSSLVTRLAAALQETHIYRRQDYAWCQFCFNSWYTNQEVSIRDEKEEWHASDCRYVALMTELGLA